MKPKIIFKTTAGTFNTEPKWALFIMPVQIIGDNPQQLIQKIFARSLLGIHRPGTGVWDAFGIKPFVSCETD